MTINRRQFIRSAAASAAGAIILPSWACSGDSSQNTAADTAGSTTETAATGLGDFGIQLYTLRDDMPKDPRGVLKELAGYGYKQIESFEGSMGMFWGMSNQDFKAYCDSLSISCVASHCDISKDFDRKAAEAAAIGMKYLVCPWVGPQKKLDDFKKIADTFNQRGQVCKTNGIRFAYHNHDYSFLELEGQLPQDVLMTNTDPDLVDYEMDIYWVVTPGADPIAWLEKYPGRWRLCHVKDRLQNVAPTEKNASCNLGTGQIDFAKILAVAKQHGMQYFIVEQERYDLGSPLNAARANAEYLKNLTLRT